MSTLQEATLNPTGAKVVLGSTYRFTIAERTRDEANGLRLRTFRARVIYITMHADGVRPYITWQATDPGTDGGGVCGSTTPSTLDKPWGGIWMAEPLPNPVPSRPPASIG